MSFDVVIAGNGIIGYSTAFALLKKNPSLKIAVIGPKVRDGGASVAAGAMLNCFAEVTTQTFATHPNCEKFKMCYSALKRWPEWVSELNTFLPPDDHLKITEGTFVLLNSRCGKLDTDNFLSIIKALKQYEEPFEEVDPASITEINPLQSLRPLRALWVPGEGCIHSHKVLGALEKAIAPATLFFEDVSQVVVEHGKATGVKLSSGKVIYGEKVLIAAGAFSQRLIDQIPEIAHTTPLVFSGVGYSLQAEQNPDRPLRHTVRTPNRAGACGLHVLPRDSETLYIGASNDLAFYPHKVPKMGMFNFVMECTFQQIDQQLTRSKLLGFHVGNRPASIDSFPLIGELSIKNLFLMTGTYRDGFHQSPLLAENMANLLCGEPGFVSDLFQPQRPLIQVKDKAGSIDEYMEHFMGSSYEHNLLLPSGILTDQEYIGFIRQRTEKLYEQLGTEYGLPPDVIFMFDLDAENQTKIKWIRSYFENMPYKEAQAMVFA